MTIQRNSLVDIATERIRLHIQEEQYQPGDRFLSEGTLVKQLQVSRTVVRESLTRLQSIGIITIKIGDGVYIGNPTVDPIKEILKHHYSTHGMKVRELVDIRKVIELGAIRLIVEKNIVVDFQTLTKRNEEYYQAIMKHDDSRAADRLFHQSLISSTENKTFYHFSEIIQEYFNLSKIELIQQESGLIQSYEEHDKMIDLLKNKDMEGAQQLMIKHLEPVSLFIKQMEDSNGAHSNK